ncbi:hypothetical protein [Rhodococcus opacus]|uniref:hypothetical protein n=1 Tax=Rhodococcus opacus TaxID=37919 RepID=UPI00030E1DA5|nr:hypothetical protein [Rhodococcus opacus]AHK36068.1 hypothetical protein Pd630_LPD16109 [Rhodococcus opacus PD630]UDH01285.1 hypothetical protein K2Z90_007756 [Rhodococcus opacus PD630]
MAKNDITTQIKGIDAFLEQDLAPLHRRIIENYRRHAILEITGEWEGIFEPDMTVEHPVYYWNITGMEGVTASGADTVKGIYKTIAEDETAVMLVEDEKLAVADWGFASDSIFNTYVRGQYAPDRGIEVDDPDGYYILRQHFAMIWRYDERARLIGEHVYENIALQEISEIPEGDFITLAEAKTALRPLLRPLPVLADTHR